MTGTPTTAPLDLAALLGAAVSAGASDLYLREGNPPALNLRLRLRGIR